MLRRLILIVFAFCLAGPAWGQEPAQKAQKPEPGTAVEMPFLMVPMSKDGELIGYANVASKLMCASPAACMRVREKLAFIQDAFVREANGKSASLASDPKELDKDMLAARLTAVAKRIVGGTTVRTTIFTEIKFAPLHPSDSPAGTAPPSELAAATATTEGAAKPDGAAKSASSEGATSKPVSGPSH